VLAGPWLKRSPSRTDTAPKVLLWGRAVRGEGGLVRAEQLCELLLEWKVRLGLSEAGWLPVRRVPGGVILPWPTRPCGTVLRLGTAGSPGGTAPACLCPGLAPLQRLCSGVAARYPGKVGD